MDINTAKDIKRNVVTIKRVIGHAVTPEETEYLEKFADKGSSGYKPPLKELLNRRFQAIIKVLTKLELVDEKETEFYTKYYITDFGKEYLAKQKVE